MGCAAAAAPWPLRRGKFESSIQTYKPYVATYHTDSNSCELEEGRCGTMSGNFTRTGAVTLLALFTVKLAYASTFSSLWYNCSVQWQSNSNQKLYSFVPKYSASKRMDARLVHTTKCLFLLQYKMPSNALEMSHILLCVVVYLTSCVIH